MKRPNKEGGIGFFNQGIVTGGVVLVATVASCAGGLVYCLVNYSWALPWTRLGLF